MLLAQWLGSLVDRVPKLPLVRGCVVIQKLSAFASYGMFFAMFFGAGVKHKTPSWTLAFDVPALGLIIVTGVALQASNTCITIAVERDWATCIAEGSSNRLSSLNAQLKRIDLLCKLLAPLFVSTLSTFMSYMWAAVIMSVLQLSSLTVELFWLETVYQSCPALARDQARKDSHQLVLHEYDEDSSLEGVSCMGSLDSCVSARSRGHWSEFAKLPTFLSSLSASFLYMTVLSCVSCAACICTIVKPDHCRFDGTMLSYLKTQGYSDATLSIMRGVNVLTGLGGTALSPWLERRLGSVRGGSWSIWSVRAHLMLTVISDIANTPRSEVLCLVPVVIALQSSWDKKELGAAVLLFGGDCSLMVSPGTTMLMLTRHVI